MRRWIAPLVGATFVLVVAATPVAAAPAAPQNPSSNSGSPAGVPADAVDLTLSQVFGSGLAVTLDSGASEEHDIVVSNHTSNLRLTVKLTATDATGRLGAAAASWLAFGDDAIQLDPHAATTIPMTIAVPHDTQPGSTLAHVSATVESAVAAADGSPVTGTATRTFPVSISVRGTATAQIAIVDVHRVDQDSTHQLAVVLRNFGDQGAQVSGHVRIAGDQPQTLPFHTSLEPSRDTTVDLDWNAPPAGSASDIAVDLEYGGGNQASWSSRLGGAPTDLSQESGSAATTPPTTAAPADSTLASAGSALAAKPWWKQAWALALGALALLGALSWFGFEISASRGRRGGIAPGPPAYTVPAGWAPPPNADSVDLAKQLVRLTDVIVQLVATHRDGWELADDRARARSPGSAIADESRPEPSPFVPAEQDDVQHARAGPAPPDAPEPAQPPLPFGQLIEAPRSASPTAGAVARPDAIADEVHNEVPDEVPDAVPDAVLSPPPASVDPIEARYLDDDEDEDDVAPVPPMPMPDDVTRAIADGACPSDGSDAVDPSASLIERLVELDRERRRLREWMDAEDSGQTIEPPAPRADAGYRPGRDLGAIS